MLLRFNFDASQALRRGVQGLAMLALAAGVGVWSAILLAPAPRPAPPALVAPTVNATDVTPVAAWFGAGPASRVKIVPSGLIAAGAQGSAILAVDGARPRAYATGQNLAHDLVLVEVLPRGVIVAQGSEETEIVLPELPRVQGILAADAQVSSSAQR